MIAKADELGFATDRIFAFVAEDIGFESYVGSLRGARGTLWSKAGNALDKASLLVALLRASGVRARYVEGTLDAADARVLVGSMFDPIQRAVGCPSDGVVRADPESSPILLGEAADHAWVELEDGGTFVAADPTFPGLALGTARGSVTARFNEVPSSRQHWVEVEVQVDKTGVGLGSSDSAIVHQTSRPSAGFVGRVLTLGHTFGAQTGSFFGQGIYTYTPYFVIAPATGPSSERDTLPGTPFQEYFLNFGSEFVSGLFVRIVLTAPDGTTEVHQRAIVDRVGAAARSGGAPPLLPSPSAPSLSEIDLVSLNILPGRQEIAELELARDELEIVETEYQAILPDAEAIIAKPRPSDEERRILAHARDLARDATLLSSQILPVLHAVTSDEALRRLQRSLLTRSYYDRPRVLMAIARAEGDKATLRLDLRRNKTRNIVVPGQVAATAAVFETTRGLFESALESHLMEAATGRPVLSTVEIWEQMPSDARLRTFHAGNVAELDVVEISPEAKARLAHAVASGKHILAYDRMAVIDGKATTAWYELDAVTGEIVGVTEDGGHQAFIEYGGLLVSGPNQLAAVIVGVSAGFSSGIFTFLAEFLGNIDEGFDKAIRAGKFALEKGIGGWIADKVFDPLFTKLSNMDLVPLKHADDALDFAWCMLAAVGVSWCDPWKQSCESNALVLSAFLGGEKIVDCVIQIAKEFGYKIPKSVLLQQIGVLLDRIDFGMFLGLVAAYAHIVATFSTDPQNLPFLIEPPGDLVAPAGEPGAAFPVAVVEDPLFFASYGGTRVRTSYRVQVHNPGSVAERFAFDFGSPPPGFALQLSTPSITVPPGETGEVGVCLVPVDAVPPAGTASEIAVQVVAEGSGQSAQSAIDLAVGPLHGIGGRSDPGYVILSPGETASASLEVRATGNVAERLSIAADVPPLLTLTGVPPGELSIASGQGQLVPIAIAADPSIALGQYRIELDANLCEDGVACGTGPLQRYLATIPVRIASPVSASLLRSASDAALSGGAAAALALEELAEVVSEFEAGGASDRACVLAARRIENVRRLVAKDALLAPLAAQLQTLRDLAAACDVGGFLAQAPGTLGALETSIGVRARFGVELRLTPNLQVTEPGIAASFTVVVTNTGSEATTVDFASPGLDPAFGASFTPAQLSLAPDETEPATLTVTPTAAGRFGFDVEARTSGSSQAIAAASGVLRSGIAEINVLSVKAAPELVLPGGSVAISTPIVNTANVPVRARARVTVTRMDGTVVFQNDLGPEIDIPSNSDLQVAELGALDTTSWGSDYFAIQVAFRTPAGRPILGGTGVGGVAVGAPVKAVAALEPLLLPPGDGIVRSTVVVEPRFRAVGVGSIEPTDPSLDRIDWAASSRGATITGATGGSGFSQMQLLDGIRTGSGNYVQTQWNLGQSFVLDLGAVRTIDTFEFRLWDGDDRFYRYRLESSLDGTTYASLVDRTTGEHRGLQAHRFPPTEMRYVRLSGTFSSANPSFHIYDEILAIGDEPDAPTPVQLVTLHGRDDAGSSRTAGQTLRLNAGVYEIRYESGAYSAWPNDTSNAGRTWAMRLDVSVPALGKEYLLGWVHSSISDHATAAAASSAALGKALKIHLPFEADVSLWIRDSNPSDNRGDETFSVTQVSGPNDSLLVRVRDAMMRSVAWEQVDVAAWEGWITASDSGCFGCHVQSQALAGLEESKRKVPDLPVEPALVTKFTDAYLAWQNPAGWVSPRHGTSHRITQTSLWAWSAATLTGDDFDRIFGRLVAALEYLVDGRDAQKVWTADHSAPVLYSDGNPTATHTAGNLSAMARVLRFPEQLNAVDLQNAQIAGGDLTIGANPTLGTGAVFARVDGVTGVRITFSDSFHSSGQIWLSEVALFDDAQKHVPSAAIANTQDPSWPIAETINQIVDDRSEGWFDDVNTRSFPMIGLWTFAAPVAIDRLRIHQHADYQPTKIRIEVTTDPVPTLASTFVPVSLTDAGSARLIFGRDVAYRAVMGEAAVYLSSASWDFDRNTRTAAQTIIALAEVLPVLDAATAAAAEARIAQATAFLRSTQRSDGAWKDTPSDSGPRVLPTAQALEALLRVAQDSVDPQILAGAEYLLGTQRADGSWTQPGADRALAPTTWVEIALPTIFENLSGLTLTVEQDVAIGNGVDPLDASFSPVLSSSQVASGVERERWDFLLPGTESSKTFQFEARVLGLQPGETRTISTGGVVSFERVDGSGSIPLPPLLVSGRHILAIDPPEIEVRPGATANFDVTLENLLGRADTFDWSIVGVDAALVTLPAPAALSPGETLKTTLAIEIPRSAPDGRFEFDLAVAGASGARDAAGAAVIVAGAPVDVAGELRGVVVEVAAVEEIELLHDENGNVVQERRIVRDTLGAGTDALFRVTVTNAGDVADDYDLASTLPAGVLGRLTAATGDEVQSVTGVLPGGANRRELLLALTGTSGATAGVAPFGVTAVSRADAAIHDDDAAQVIVSSFGVEVAIDPASGGPAMPYRVTVTNRGAQEDSFALEMLGGAAHLATPATAQLGPLAPGAAAVVDVILGPLQEALAGGVELVARAASQRDPKVVDRAVAAINVQSRRTQEVSCVPSEQVIGQPGEASFLVVVSNSGNVDEALGASIVGTTGPITAGFERFDGSLADAVSLFRVPPLAVATLVLRATLTAVGQGEVSVGLGAAVDPPLLPSTATCVLRTGVGPTPTESPVVTPTPTSAPTPASGSADALKCYRVRVKTGTPQFTPLEGVAIEDQFTSTSFDVIREIHLCNGADLDPQGQPEMDGHLTCYTLRHEPGQPPLDLAPMTIRNRFGDQQVRFLERRNLETFCVPSTARLEIQGEEELVEGMGRYLCRRVRGTPRRLPAQPEIPVADEFETKLMRVRALYQLCTPAGVEGNAFDRSRTMLGCYDVSQVPRQRAFAPPGTVVIDNELAEQRVIVRNAQRRVCVPTTTVATP